jgi:hypothetical protein
MEESGKLEENIMKGMLFVESYDHNFKFALLLGRKDKNPRICSIPSHTTQGATLIHRILDLHQDQPKPSNRPLFIPHTSLSFLRP